MREIKEARIREKQRQTEIALQETEEQLKLALKMAKLGSWELNLQTNILSTSVQCKLNFGLPLDADFSHQILMSRIHQSDRVWVQKAIEQAIANHTDYDVEYRNIWADNTIHWVLVRGRCIYDSVGNPLRMVGMSMDITERKLAEVEREELLKRSLAALEQAETANRIKDEFLAVLSHELRTPLNPILGWTTLLRTKKFDPVTTERALETIERNAKLQTQLINDLLDISRILRGKLSLTVMPVNSIDYYIICPGNRAIIRSSQRSALLYSDYPFYWCSQRRRNPFAASNMEFIILCCSSSQNQM